MLDHPSRPGALGPDERRLPSHPRGLAPGLFLLSVLITLVMVLPVGVVGPAGPVHPSAPTLARPARPAIAPATTGSGPSAVAEGTSSSASSAPSGGVSSAAGQALLSEAVASLGPSAKCTGEEGGSESCSWAGDASVRPAGTSGSGTSEWQGGGTPAARYNVAMAYYPPLSEVVMFGGYTLHGGATAFGDTWTYRAGVWNETGLTGPSGRYGASMIWYPPASSLVLFGGYEGSSYLSDTWLFNGAWSMLTTATAPSGRNDFAFTFDSTLDCGLLFGGFTSSGIAADTWTLCGASPSWTGVAVGGPNARWGAVLADDPTNSEAVLFGGISNPTNTHNDTWVYTGSSWKNITFGLNPEPPARYAAGMAWDSVLGEDVLTGGYSFSTGTYYNDTWGFVNGAWTDLGVGQFAVDPARGFSPLVFDKSDGVALLFGGASTSGYLNDTWQYSATGWSPAHLPLLSTTGPSGRTNDSLAYDGTNNSVILFGGEAGTGGTVFSDLWQFENGVWTNLTLSSEPTGVFSAGLVWDNGTDTVYLFGGSDGITTLDQFESYSFLPHDRTWAAGPALVGTTLGARSELGMAWDPAQGLIVFAGGHSSISGALSTVYTYRPSTQTLTAATSLPSDLENFALVNNSLTSGSLLLYGGDTGTASNPATYEGTISTPSTITWSQLSTTDLIGGVDLPWYAYDRGTNTALSYHGYPFGHTPSESLGNTNRFSLATDTWSSLSSTAGTPPDSVGSSNLVTDYEGKFFFGAGGSPYYSVPAYQGGLTVDLAIPEPDWIYGPTLTNTLSLPTSVDSGDSLQGTATAAGGSGNYRYDWYGLPPDCSSTTTLLSCFPAAVAVNTTYTVQVEVVDSLGDVASVTQSVTVHPALTVSGTSTPSVIDEGQSVVLHASATGGDGAYTWSWLGLPAGCTAVGAGNFEDCTPGSVLSNTTDGGIVATVSDGSGGSSQTGLSFTEDVYPKVSPVHASVAAIDSGQSVTFWVDPTYGTAPYSYAWSGLPGLCIPMGGGTTCTPSVASNTSYTIGVRLTDSVGDGVFAVNLTFVVHPALDLGPISLSATQIDSGQVVSISVGPTTGGATPYTYTWTGLPAACGTPSVNYLSCSPTVVATTVYTIGVSVKDATGETVGAPTSAQLTVNPALSVSGVTISPSGGVDSGNGITITADYTGGTGPFTFTWTGLPAGCTPLDSATISCTPSANNVTYGSINVQVQDSLLESGTATAAPYEVYATLALSGPTANPYIVNSGVPTTFTSTPSGGKAGYSFSWSGFPSGCSTTDEDALTCTPTSATNQTYTITLTVTDALGYLVSGTLSFRVREALTVSPPAVSPDPVDSGETITFSTTAHFGTGVYNFTWSGLPASCTPIDSPVISCAAPTVASNTTYAISVTVNDGSSPGDGSALTPASTTLQVDADPSVSAITLAPSPEVESLLPLTLKVTAHLGDGVYTFQWFGLPTGCSSADTPTLTCTPNVAANQTFSSIYVQVTDDTAAWVDSAMASETVLAPLAVSSLSSSPPGFAVDSGQSVTFSAIVIQGDGDYTFTWSGLPSACTPVDLPVLSCAPPTSFNVSYLISLQVTDGHGGSASTSSKFHVYESPTLSNGTAVPSPVDSGTALRLNATARFGSGVYSFVWSNLPTGCSTSNTPVLLCTPNVATNQTFSSITVVLTDSFGTAILYTLPSLLVYAPLALSGIIPTPALGADAGQAVTFTVIATGGQGSYSFSWTNLPTGCVAVDERTISCSPSVATNTTFPVDVSVADGLSTHVSDPKVLYTIWADPQVSAIAFSVNPLDSGQTVVLSVVATLGDGTYSFAWSGLPAGCVTSNTPDLLCVPSVGANTTYSSIQVAVTDTTGTSASTALPSATLMVNGPVTVTSITVSSSMLESGQLLTLSVTATQGSGTYSFAWSNLPGGCTTANTPVLTCLPSVGSNTTFSSIKVVATDSLAQSASGSAPSVTVLAPLAISPISATLWEAESGQVVSFSVMATAGSGSYSYDWTSLLPSCTTVDERTASCPATAPSSYAIVVSVTDTDGGSVVSSPFNFRVIPALIAGAASANLTHFDVGNVSLVSVSASFGLGPYSFSWVNLPSGCVAGNVSSFACDPSAAGTFWIKALVTDRLGFTNTSGVALLVVSPAPTVGPVSASPATIDLGETVTFRAAVAGGVGALTYVWWGLPAGCIASAAPSFSCTPGLAFSGTVGLEVIDSQGGKGEGSGAFTVYADLQVSIATPDGTTTETGVALSLVGSVLDGSPGYHTYAWSLNTSGPISPADNTSLLELVLEHGGSYLVTLTVTDADGGSGQGTSASILVVLHLTVSILPIAKFLDEGQVVRMVATYSGGVGPVLWQWYAAGVSLGSACSDLYCNYTALAAGTVSFTLRGNDSLGVHATSPAVSLTVNPLPSVSIPGTGTSTTGETVWLNASAGLGTPGYAYTWYVNGSASPAQSGASGTFRFETAHSGTYEVWVVVNDSLGGIGRSADANISVATSTTTPPGHGGGGSGAGPSTTSFLTSPTGILVLLLVLLAVIAAAAIALRRRRSAATSEAEEAQEPEAPSPEEGAASPMSRTPGASAAGAAATVPTPKPTPVAPVTAAQATPAPSASPPTWAPAPTAAELAATTAASVAAAGGTVAPSSKPTPADWEENEEPDWTEEEEAKAAVAPAPAPEAPPTPKPPAPTTRAPTPVPSTPSAKPKMVLGSKGVSKPVTAAGAGAAAGAAGSVGTVDATGKVHAKEPPWPMTPLTVVETNDRRRFWRMAASSGLDREKMLIISPEAPGVVTSSYGMHGATIYRLSRNEGEMNVSPGDGDRLGYLIESHMEMGSGRVVVLDGIASIVDAINIRTARRLIEHAHDMAEKTSGAALVWVNPDTMGQVERRQIEEKAVVRRLL